LVSLSARWSEALPRSRMHEFLNALALWKALGQGAERLWQQIRDSRGRAGPDRSHGSARVRSCLGRQRSARRPCGGVWRRRPWQAQMSGRGAMPPARQCLSLPLEGEAVHRFRGFGLDDGRVHPVSGHLEATKVEEALSSPCSSRGLGVDGLQRGSFHRPWSGT